MNYVIAVHPDVLERIECLPAITRSKLVALFQSAISCGLAFVGPRNLHWNQDDRFTLTVNQNLHEVRMQNGAIAKGFCNDASDSTIYVSALFCIRDGKCTETGQRDSQLKHCHLPGPHDIDDYVILDADWFDNELRNPFVRKAHSSRDSALRVPVTAPMHIENDFFSSVHRTMLSELDSGSLPPLPGAIADRLCYRVRFDADDSPPQGRGDLRAYLESLRKWPHTLVLVSFIDELDPLSVAQQGFFNLIVPFLRGQYPHLKIQLVDVVIRDRQGRKFYRQEFAYFARRLAATGRTRPVQDKAAPFTMVIGGPLEPTEEKPALPADRDRRLVDIDLYSGCRRGAADRDRTYKANLRRAIHDVMRIAGILTDTASIPVKSFRGRSELDVSKAIVNMAMTSVVVVVRDERDSAAFRAAESACAHAALVGFPYVSIILADPVGDDGLWLVVNAREGKNFVYANPPDDPIRDDDLGFVRMLIEDIEEAYGENPYLAEILSGTGGSSLSSPLLM